jgi:hypothetical protein
MIEAHWRCGVLMLACGSAALPQQSAEAIAKDVRQHGRAVEALSFLPPGTPPFPGVLAIPGYQRTAVDLIPPGARLAAEEFAGVAVTQPGFGRSQGAGRFRRTENA